MLLLIVNRFIWGRLVCGKKQPALTYSLAANLSKDPMISMWPSGSMKKAIEGLDIWLIEEIGDASMTPPILQKCSINYSHDLNNVFYAILTFLGSTFLKTSISFSIMPSVISTFFFRSSIIVFTFSIFRKAWPLPLYSSSILKIQVLTNKLFEINLAKLTSKSLWS